MSTESPRPPVIARAVRKLAPLIIVGWVALTLILTFAIPSLEEVGRENSVSLMPADAPSAKAMKRIGKDFQESDSDSFAMIVLEGQEPLGEKAHEYYDELVRQLRNDPKHVQHIQDLWGDTLTASSVQSRDRLAAYVQMNLAGNQGTKLGDESVAAVRHIVNRTPAPPGVDAYVTGAAPLVSDMQHSGNNSIVKITVVTVVIIFTMLMFVYRSVITVILLLVMVGIELGAARGIVAFLGHHDILLLSTFAINLLMSLGIAAGTDYGIFFFGRYQEARRAGEDREAAYYSAYRGVAPVVLASGLTIAGAMFCLSFARLPYFSSMGIPCALGMFVAVAVAVTLVPAGVAVASRFGLLERKRQLRVGRWRGLGTAVVRWPAPILVATCAVALVGLLALPGYKTSYDDRLYMPNDLPANVGFAAAEEHFSQSRLMPDILLVEADHDMRNPTDFLVLNKVAKSVFKVHGISRVQGITRPEGTPIAKTSIPFLLSLQAAGQVQAQQFQNERMDDILKQADDMTEQIAEQERQYELMKRMTAVMFSMIDTTHGMQETVDTLRDRIADFDDFLRPFRNYLYWEPHCFDVPICWSLRAVLDAVDGADQTTDKLSELVRDLEAYERLLPLLITQFPEMIASMKTMRTLTLSTHSTMSGLAAQMDETSGDVATMGLAFDAAKSDDSFYLPPEVFENPDFQKAMEAFLSPDGKAARFIISHRGDPATLEGISRVPQIKTAAEEALKGTPLAGGKVFLAGASVTAKDWHDGSTYDLWIAGIAALCLIFVIMLIVTRGLIAALVIVGTVALSLGASFGLSVLVWQYIVGIKLHWMVLAMSVIILLAVGSDYNLLLVSRIKEEVRAGINTGIIRAMGGTGKVVTSAGVVFAVTMGSMVVSDLRIIGQVGTTIGLGLLFDTFIVRSFMTPSIAALLGRWFWWPQQVRQRPASALLEPLAPRPVTRALLLGERFQNGGGPVGSPGSSGGIG